MIRAVKSSDASQICDIYNYYIAETIATFEEDCLKSEDIEERISAISLKYPWIVLEENNEILGYAYASSWKTRAAYKNTAEVTVYLKPNVTGKGLGKKLYTALIEEMKQRMFHVLMGVISLPNDASVSLHEKFGFKKAAHFNEVGYKFNKWIDVGYWQLII